MLYIVATPIGNLKDMTPRAIEVLQSVDLIAAEDTRHSKPLLQHFAIDTPLLAYHDHNETSQTEKLIAQLQAGKQVALISDAGTPLISDPGYQLVQRARTEGIEVVPVPGVSAIITALCAAGLPTDSFYFHGFLPVKSVAKTKLLEQLACLGTTLIFYESPKRILDTLTAVTNVTPAATQVVVARELTKKFETFYTGSASSVLQQLNDSPEQQRGEFVLLLHPPKKVVEEEISLEAQTILKKLLAELPLKQAAKLAADITGLKKNQLYQWALEHQNNAGS